MERIIDTSTNSSSRQGSCSKVSLQRVYNKTTSTADLTCRICECVLPLRDGETCSSCGEQFCVDCVEDKIKKEFENKCPYCEIFYRSGTLPRVVRNLLRDLKILCVNCNQAFNYEDLGKHEDECLYRPKKCMGCEQFVTMKDYEDHISFCEEIKIKCQKCGYESNRRNFNHECNTIKFLSLKINNLSNKIDLLEESILSEREEKTKKFEEELDFKLKISLSRIEEDLSSNIKETKNIESMVKYNLDERLNSIEENLKDIHSQAVGQQQKITNEFHDRLNILEAEVKNGFQTNDTKIHTIENQIQTDILKYCEKKFESFENTLMNFETKLNENLTMIKTNFENNLEYKTKELEERIKFSYEEKISQTESNLIKSFHEKINDNHIEIKKLVEEKNSLLEEQIRIKYEDKLKKETEEIKNYFENNLISNGENLVSICNGKLKNMETSLKNQFEENLKIMKNSIQAVYDDKIDLLMKKIYYNREKLLNLQEDSVIEGESNVMVFLPLDEYDNNCILCGFDNGAINSYNLNTGELVNSYREHTSDIYDLKYIGNYRRGYFASCCNNKLIKIWDLTDEKSIKTYSCTSSATRIESLYNFSNEGFLSGDENGNIHIWNLEMDDCKLMTEEVKHKSYVFSLTHFKTKSPYNLMASGGNNEDHTIYLWDLNTLKCIMSYDEHTHHIYSISFYKEDLFLSSSEDKTIKLWSIYENKSVATLNIHQSDVFSLLVIPEEDLLISSSFDKTLKITDLNKKKVLKSYKTNEYMRVVVLLKDNKYRVIGSNYWSKNIMVLSIKYE